MGDNVVALLNGALNADIGGTTRDSQEGDDYPCGWQDLRLRTDIELFCQQFNEAKLDSNVSICAILGVASVQAEKGK